MPDSPVPETVATGALPKASYAWAFQAYDAFVQSLSPEVRQHLGEHREASYTVAFGKTQMGKSTLILNLLGLSSEAVRHVSTVLRGGRTSGNSSTAIPTEYRRSRDERWRIAWGSRVQECIDDADAMAAFAEVRHIMECNEIFDDLVLCVVEIPERYFDAENPLLCDTRILDLPGADAANPIERQFVTRVAESLVPNADMILLVGRADDLSFLSSDHLNLPGLSDWQLNPRRFRVVTTFSFTPESIRTFSRDTDCWGNEDAYRQRLIGQIERFGSLALEARAPELYFPLEFGETWENAKDLQATQLAPMMKRLMQRLRQDIATANSPLGRLEGAIAVHGVVARVHATRLQNMKAEENRLEQVYSNRRQSHCELISEYSKRKEFLRGIVDNALSNADIWSKLKFLSDEYMNYASAARDNRLKQVAGDSITRGMFQSAIAAMRDDLKKLVTSISELMTESTMLKPKVFWKLTWKTYSNSGATNNVNAKSDPFAALEDRLKGYWLDTYWFTDKDSQYARDRKDFIIASDKLAAQFASNLKREVAKCALAVQKKLREEERLVDAQVRDIEQQIHEHQFSCERMLQDINTAIMQREEIEAEMKDEQDRSQKFARLLSSAYNRSLESTYRGVLQAPDAVSAFKHLVLGSTFRATRESVGARMIGKFHHEHI